MSKSGSNELTVKYIAEADEAYNLAREARGLSEEQVAELYTKAALNYAEAAAFGDEYGLEKLFALGRDLTKGSEEERNVAVQFFKMAGNHGHGPSLCALAECYRDGIGVSPSREQVFLNYEKATKVRTLYAPAFCQLGDCYRDGIGVERSPDDAAINYIKAAELGDTSRVPEVMEIAENYQNGTNGFERNPNKAFKLFKSLAAAVDDNVLAQLRLADCYRRGEGVPKQLDKAAEIFVRLVNNGHDEGLPGLDLIASEDLSAISLESINMLIERGCEKPIRWLAMKHHRGIDGVVNLDKAAELYEKFYDRISDRTSEQSKNDFFALAQSYQEKGDPNSLKKAVKYYQKTAEKNGPRYDSQNAARRELGKCYLDGIGVKKDSSQALWHFAWAATGGDSFSSEILTSKHFGKYDLAVDETASPLKEYQISVISTILTNHFHLPTLIGPRRGKSNSSTIIGNLAQVSDSELSVPDLLQIHRLLTVSVDDYVESKSCKMIRAQAVEKSAIMLGRELDKKVNFQDVHFYRPDTEGHSRCSFRFTIPDQAETRDATLRQLETAKEKGFLTYQLSAGKYFLTLNEESLKNLAEAQAAERSTPATNVERPAATTAAGVGTNAEAERLNR